MTSPRLALRFLSNKWVSRIGGIPCLACSLSDDCLVRLLTRLKSHDPPRDLAQIRQGSRSLVGTCLDLLTGGKEVFPEEFVQGSYRGLLGREPDEAGFRSFKEALTAGPLTRAEFVASLLRSPEIARLAELEPVPPRPQPQTMSQRLAYADRLHRLAHPRAILPPFYMRYVVGEGLGDICGQEFELRGRGHVERLSKDGSLGRRSRVLDLGSGCGRTTLALTEVLDSPGCYVGLEVIESLVKWCQENITARFAHFRFIHCDVHNGTYNPQGKQRAETFQFPCAQNYFDLVVAVSVFTHLLPEAVKNYAAECARVLRPGGKLFATFFLIESGTVSADGGLRFTHPVSGGALSVDPTLPEKGLAYRTDWLLEVFLRAGLDLVPPVRWGTWSGKQPNYDWQDVLILQKQ